MQIHKPWQTKTHHFYYGLDPILKIEKQSDLENSTNGIKRKKENSTTLGDFQSYIDIAINKHFKNCWSEHNQITNISVNIRVSLQYWKTQLREPTLYPLIYPPRVWTIEQVYPMLIWVLSEHFSSRCRLTTRRIPVSLLRGWHPGNRYLQSSAKCFLARCTSRGVVPFLFSSPQSVFCQMCLPHYLENKNQFLTLIFINHTKNFKQSETLNTPIFTSWKSSTDDKESKYASPLKNPLLPTPTICKAPTNPKFLRPFSMFGMTVLWCVNVVTGQFSKSQIAIVFLLLQSKGCLIKK